MKRGRTDDGGASGSSMMHRAAGGHGDNQENPRMVPTPGHKKMKHVHGVGGMHPQHDASFKADCAEDAKARKPSKVRIMKKPRTSW